MGTVSETVRDYVYPRPPPPRDDPDGSDPVRRVEDENGDLLVCCFGSRIALPGLFYFRPHEREQLPVRYSLDSEPGKKPMSVSYLKRDLVSVTSDDHHVHLVSGFASSGLNGAGMTTTRLTGHNDTVTGSIYIPERNRLATCSYDKTIRLWSLPEDTVAGDLQELLPGEILETGRERGLDSLVTCLCRPDDTHSNLLVAGYRDGFFATLDLVKNRRTRLYRAHEGNLIHSMEFSSNSNLLITSTSECVRMWDCRQPEETVVVRSRTYRQNLLSVMWPKADTDGHTFLVGLSNAIELVDSRYLTPSPVPDDLTSRIPLPDRVFNPWGLSEVDSGHFAAATEKKCIMWKYNKEVSVNSWDFPSPTVCFGICHIPRRDEREPGRVSVEVPLSPRIEKCLIEAGDKIGSGAQAKIYQGTFRQWGETGEIVDVAIKQFVVHSQNPDPAAREEDFIRQVKEAGFLARLSSQNIVHCYGWSLDDSEELSPGKWCAIVRVILELCPRGDLAEYLKTHPSLPLTTRLSFLRQIAEGMDYVHQQLISHSDLSLENILLGEGDTVKITDFGLSRNFNSIVGSKAICGNPRYIPPESHRNRYVKDVYAFGILAWEIWNGKKAYEHLHCGGLALLIQVRRKKLRPSTQGIPKDLRDLMERCWSDVPEARPSFRKIVQELQGWDLESSAWAPEETGENGDVIAGAEKGGVEGEEEEEEGEGKAEERRSD